MKYNILILTDGRIVNDLGEELLSELNTKLKLIEDSYDHCLLNDLYSDLECNIRRLKSYKNVIEEFLQNHDVSDYVRRKFKYVLDDIATKLSLLSKKEQSGILNLQLNLPIKYKLVNDDIVQIRLFDDKIIFGCKYDEIETKVNGFIKNISITFDTVQGSKYIQNFNQPSKITLRGEKID